MLRRRMTLSLAMILAAGRTHGQEGLAGREEHGVYRIYAGDDLVGEETWTLEPSDEGTLVVKGRADHDFTVLNDPVRLKYDATMSQSAADGSPILYGLIAEVNRRPQETRVTFARGVATCRTLVGREETVRDVKIPKGTLLLDRNLFHQYLPLIRRIPAPGSVPVFVPSTKGVEEARLTDRGEVVATHRKEAVTLRRIEVATAGQTAIVYRRGDREVPVIDVPARKLRAVLKEYEGIGIPAPAAGAVPDKPAETAPAIPEPAGRPPAPGETVVDPGPARVEAAPDSGTPPPAPAKPPPAEVEPAPANAAGRGGAAGTDASGGGEGDVEIGSGGVRLTGLLTLPTGPGPFPAVVLVSSAGPQDRDGDTEPAAAGSLGAVDFVPEGPPGKLFAAISDRLNRAGIAVLRWDDRGVGGSGGNPGEVTPAVELDDTAAVLTFLRGRPGVDPDRVGVVAHGTGCTIALHAAGTVRAFALISPLARPAATLHLETLPARLAAEGASPEAAAGMTARARESMDRIRTAEGDRLTLDGAPVFVGWMKGHLALDPAAAFVRFRGKVLIITPAADRIVPPSESEALMALSREGDGPAADKMRAEGADHRLRLGDGRVSAAVLDGLADWLAKALAPR